MLSPGSNQCLEYILFTIQCDFDGTITIQDIGAALLETFCPGTWRQIEDEYRSGKISVEEEVRRQFAGMRVSHGVILDFVAQTAEVRPGFSQLVGDCRKEGMRFVIVSNGLDLYIEPILQELGLPGLERYSGRAGVTAEGITVDYIYPGGANSGEGFKLACLRHLRAGGMPIVYIGDAISDILPAREADHVIARGELLDHFRLNRLSHSSFETFYDVQDHLQRLRHLYP